MRNERLASAVKYQLAGRCPDASSVAERRRPCDRSDFAAGETDRDRGLRRYDSVRPAPGARLEFLVGKPGLHLGEVGRRRGHNVIFGLMGEEDNSSAGRLAESLRKLHKPADLSRVVTRSDQAERPVAADKRVERCVGEDVEAAAPSSRPSTSMAATHPLPREGRAEQEVRRPSSSFLALRLFH